MCGLVNVHIVDIVEIVDIHSEIVQNSKMVRDFLLFKLEFFCIESRDKFWLSYLYIFREKERLSINITHPIGPQNRSVVKQFSLIQLTIHVGLTVNTCIFSGIPWQISWTAPAAGKSKETWSRNSYHQVTDGQLSPIIYFLIFCRFSIPCWDTVGTLVIEWYGCTCVHGDKPIPDCTLLKSETSLSIRDDELPPIIYCLWRTVDRSSAKKYISKSRFTTKLLWLSDCYNAATVLL